MATAKARLLSALLIACVVLQLATAAGARTPFSRSLKAPEKPAEVPPKAAPAKTNHAPTAQPTPAERAEEAREAEQDLKHAAAEKQQVFSIAAYQAKDPNYTSPFPTITGAAGTEISSSVSVFYHGDWDVTYLGEGADYGADYTSRCIDMVYKAADSKARVVNFVITHYWADTRADGTVDYYCTKLKYGYGCQKVNRLAIDRFRFGMQWCFNKAIQMGLSIAVTPHLDDGLELGGWRNALAFDPLAKYSGYSYWDVMLQPLAQALNAVITPDTQVWFAMQGEMSATIVRHPTSYTSIIPRLKAAMLAGREDAELLRPNILVGVSTNFNKLCACVLMDLVDPNEYLTRLPAALAPIRDQFNTTAIAELYESVDLIGISSYAGLKADFKQADLEDAIWQFDTEVKEFGVDLKDLIHNKGKAFVLSEYGVGGGIAQNGSVPAATISEAGLYPFFGIWGVYDVKTDPWKTYLPDSVDVPTRTWRRRYYKQTSRWLVANGGPLYRVDGVYLWNLASWDVQAIHYASYDNTGHSYRDWMVADRIRAHNTFVNGEYRRRLRSA